MTRAPIDMPLDDIEWKACEGEPPNDGSGLPWVTHEGVLRVGEFSFRCFQLSDGQRILDADDVIAFIGGLR